MVYKLYYSIKRSTVWDYFGTNEKEAENKNSPKCQELKDKDDGEIFLLNVIFNLAWQPK